MNLTEEIKTEENDMKGEDLFYTLLTGKTIEDTITTSRGKFTVKYPKQKDLMFIDRKVAILRGGVPAACFDAESTFTLQKIAFLDTVIVSGDPWFEAVKKKNPNFSWGEVPDINFVNEVYVKAWTFRNEIQRKFESASQQGSDGNSVSTDVSAPVADGVFKGITG